MVARLRLLIIVAFSACMPALLSLSACGGGGGGTSSPPPAPVPVTYTVGGTASGLAGSGLVLRNNGGDNLAVAANGAFAFATTLASGVTYSVTVLTQPTNPSQTCDVTNGSGTVSAGNVTDIAVTCANTGFVVAARANPAEINIYRADQPDVPIETIAGATFTNELRDGAGTRLGVVYGKFAAPGVYFELGVFLQSTRVVLAAAGGHSYEYLGLIDAPIRRAVFLDTVGTDVGVRTATLDGLEDHLVKSGCTTVTVPVFSSAGVAFLCKQVGVNKIWHSDGVAPAVYMTGSDMREPMALTTTHLLSGEVSAARQIHTQPLAGALSGSVQVDQDLYTGMIDDNGEEYLLAVNPQGFVLGRTFHAGQLQPWEAWSVNSDLSCPTCGPDNEGNPHSLHRSYMAPLFIELSPDGSQATVIYQSQFGIGMPSKGAVIALALPQSNVPPYNPLYVSATESVSDLHFLSGGKFAGTWGPRSASTGLYVHNADGSVFTQVSAYAGSNFVDTTDDYLLYVGGTPTQVFASSLINGTADLTLSPAAQQPLPTLRSDGYVTFVDDAALPWIASADPTIPVALRVLQQIDAVPTDSVLNVGDGPGNRVFLTLHRSNGDGDVVMFDLDDRTTTPIVSGATYDTGYFFPN